MQRVEDPTTEETVMAGKKEHGKEPDFVTPREPQAKETPVPTTQVDPDAPEEQPPAADDQD